MGRKYGLAILFLLATVFCFGQKNTNKSHYKVIDPAFIASIKPNFNTPPFSYDKKIMNEKCPVIFTELVGRIVDFFYVSPPPKPDLMLYYFYVLK